MDIILYLVDYLIKYQIYRSKLDENYVREKINNIDELICDMYRIEIGEVYLDEECKITDMDYNDQYGEPKEYVPDLLDKRNM